MSAPRLASLLALALSTLAACGSEGPMGDPGPQGPAGSMGGMGDPGAPGQEGQNGTTGLACWDLNGNGTCDVATEDIDDGGTCDVGDCIGPEGPQGEPGQPGASGTAGQGATSVFGSAPLALSGTMTGSMTVVPGLTTTLTVPAGHVAYITSTGGIQTTATTSTTASAADVVLRVDGDLFPNGGYQRVLAAPNEAVLATIANWNLSIAAPISAGTHTFDVATFAVSGSVDMTVSGNNTSVLQGTLTVLFLKL